MARAEKRAVRKTGVQGAGEPATAREEPDERAVETSRVLTELTYTFFRTRVEADRITGVRGQSSGRYGLLGTLVREGPRTVAEIARSRPVARQGVQRLADDLAAEGLVEYLDNPRHRRSRLLRITPAGERTWRALSRLQLAHAGALGADIPLTDLRTAARVLRALRERLVRLDAERSHATAGRLRRRAGEG